jgi:hypothetical protein
MRRHAHQGENAMAKPEEPDPNRLEGLMDEARRLASSGKYATWHEVQDALLADGHARDDVHALFAQKPALRDEIEALAEAAHGVGGPATE